MVHLSQSGAFAAIAFLVSSAQGHMMMKTPMPYGKSSLNNSPLAADGSDFPCKQRAGVYDAEGASNIAAIGEPQTLSFIGGATHGGGSCQVSLTTDLQPNKNSKWMVIKSIEGGCPSSFPGNMNDDAASTGASTFQYTIPDGIAPGDYTIAWTWFNHIGNREMYMNCGPMTVTSPKKKRYSPAPKISKKRQTSFPDMYVANINGASGCVTPQQVDLQFPNPGADVQSAGNGPYAAPTCDLGGGSGGAPAQPTGAAATTAPAAGVTTASVVNQQPQPTASGFANGSGGGGSNTGAPKAGPTAAVTQTPAPPAGPTGTAPAAPSAAPSGSIENPTAVGALSGPCSNEGDWNCIDGSSFQRCASGAWSVAIPMSGMKCTPGEASNFVMTPGKAKRFEA